MVFRHRGNEQLLSYGTADRHGDDIIQALNEVRGEGEKEGSG
jgi:hypothetical protein